MSNYTHDDIHDMFVALEKKGLNHRKLVALTDAAQRGPAALRRLVEVFRFFCPYGCNTRNPHLPRIADDASPPLASAEVAEAMKRLLDPIHQAASYPGLATDEHDRKAWEEQSKKEKRGVLVDRTTSQSGGRRTRRRRRRHRRKTKHHHRGKKRKTRRRRRKTRRRRKYRRRGTTGTR